MIAALAALASGPAGGVVLAGGRGVAIDPVRILVALAIVLIAAWLAALLMARLRRGKGLPGLAAGGSRGQDLKMRASCRVGPGADVCLVEWGRKQYLVGVTAGAMSVLDSRDLAGDGDGQTEEAEEAGDAG